MTESRVVSVLTVIAFLLCVLAGYFLSSQAHSYQNAYVLLQNEIIDSQKKQEAVVRSDADKSNEDRIVEIVSVFDKASETAAKVVAAEESINEIMAQLDSGVFGGIDSQALYARLFEEYGVIDSIFDTSVASTPWFNLDVSNDASKDFHWRYRVSKNLNGMTVPILFTMENESGDLLAYVLAMYDAFSDSMWYLKRFCTYDSFGFLPKNVEENGLVDDSDEAFVESVIALTDKLGYSKSLIEGDPEQEPDPDDEDWNAVAAYREAMVASDVDYDDFYDGEPEWGDE